MTFTHTQWRLMCQLAAKQAIKLTRNQWPDISCVSDYSSSSSFIMKAVIALAVFACVAAMVAADGQGFRRVWVVFGETTWKYYFKFLHCHIPYDYHHLSAITMSNVFWKLRLTNFILIDLQLRWKCCSLQQCCQTGCGEPCGWKDRSFQWNLQVTIKPWNYFNLCPWHYH